MSKTAILFAGQGSQSVNMGKDFYDRFDYVKELYEEASEVLGYDLTEIVFKENELINQTLYTQPSILVTSLAIYEVLKREKHIQPDVMAGFSLGEYSALPASGVFDYSTIIQLIKKRAMWMEEATQLNKGGMAAIIGMDQTQLEQLCTEISTDDALVQIANYNCPNQLVVGGHYDQVIHLCDLAKERGAKRAIMLNVSGGFHTPLMTSASELMREEVKKTSYQKPLVEVIMNCNASSLDIHQLPELMKQQINSPVLFEASIRKMIDSGVTQFIEIGPGSVLSGFVRKIDRSLSVISINSMEDLNKL